MSPDTCRENNSRHVQASIRGRESFLIVGTAVTTFYTKTTADRVTEASRPRVSRTWIPGNSELSGASNVHRSVFKPGVCCAARARTSRTLRRRSRHVQKVQDNGLTA